MQPSRKPLTRMSRRKKAARAGTQGTLIKTLHTKASMMLLTFFLKKTLELKTKYLVQLLGEIWVEWRVKNIIVVSMHIMLHLVVVLINNYVFYIYKMDKGKFVAIDNSSYEWEEGPYAPVVEREFQIQASCRVCC